jgi:hypothetical protein
VQVAGAVQLSLQCVCGVGWGGGGGEEKGEAEDSKGLRRGQTQCRDTIHLVASGWKFMHAMHIMDTVVTAAAARASVKVSHNVTIHPS